jgi:hypothetical protein
MQRAIDIVPAESTFHVRKAFQRWRRLRTSGGVETPVAADVVRPGRGFEKSCAVRIRVFGTCLPAFEVGVLAQQGSQRRLAALIESFPGDQGGDAMAGGVPGGRR